MKTLDEILNRNDYVRLSDELAEKAIDIARAIRQKMNDLDEQEIGNNMHKSTGCIVRISNRKANGYTDEFLTIKSCDGYGGYSYNSLETRKSYYFMGDFNCRIESATNKEILRFLNNARDLLDGLDEMESDKVDEMNKVLEKVNDIKSRK